MDRNLDAEEAEELFRWLDTIKDPEKSDAVFREEWLHGQRPYTIDEVTWERIQRLSSAKNEVKQTRTTSMVLVKWVAAASLIIAAALIWWLNTGEPEMVVYQTDYGETLPIVLNDGTSVILNANSRLTWNKDWKGRESGRYAELTGEAYFKVSHIDHADETEVGRLPFVVKTPDLSVNVLGTAFNVLSRRGHTDVYLDEGKVKLELLHDDNDEKRLQSSEEIHSVELIPDTLIMKPGDLVSFSAQSGELHQNKKLESKAPMNWKDGTLTFTKKPFGKVLSSLEDIYGKQFEVKDTAMMNRKVTLALPYENWATVRKLIEVSLNLEFVENENKDVLKIKKGQGNY